MTILFLDSECNSLDTEGGFIQELAWVIADTKSFRTLKVESHLIKWLTSYEVEEGAIAVTGLSREYCEEHGELAQRVFTNFLFDAGCVDFICGHNLIGYDHPMLATNVQRACLSSLERSDYAGKLKIDTLTDCPYPSNMKIHALKYLAYDHGFILSDAHQALADVFACKHLLSKYDLAEVIEIAKTPMVTLTAKIDFKNVEGRDKIKNARFYWEPNKKLWTKRIREFHLKDMQESLGADIEIVTEA